MFVIAVSPIGGLGIFSEAKLNVHYVPGEHDFIDEGLGKAYLDRYGKGTKGQVFASS